MNIGTAAELADCLMDRIDEWGMRILKRNTVEVQDYFTRKEAAKYLRVGLRKIDELTASGKLSRAKLGDKEGSCVIFRKIDLDEYVERQLEEY